MHPLYRIARQPSYGRPRMRLANTLLVAIVLVAALLAAGCGSDGDEDATPSAAVGAFGSAPATPEGELTAETAAATDSLFDGALQAFPMPMR